MSDEFQLNAELRTDVGKGASRRLRRLSDLVPGVIYGAGKEPTSVTFSHKDLMKALENEAFYSHIITLNVDGNHDKAILKDLQRHPAKNRLLHADFFRVSMDQEIKVHVPLHFLNEEACIGVKLAGGSISHLLVEVEVTCLPDDLPEYIEVDMLNVDLGQSIHLTDLVLPPGTRIAALLQGEDHDIPVASVHATRATKEVSDTAEDDVEEEGADDDQ